MLIFQCVHSTKDVIDQETYISSHQLENFIAAFAAKQFGEPIVWEFNYHRFKGMEIKGVVKNSSHMLVIRSKELS